MLIRYSDGKKVGAHRNFSSEFLSKASPGHDKTNCCYRNDSTTHKSVGTGKPKLCSWLEWEIALGDVLELLEFDVDIRYFCIKYCREAIEVAVQTLLSPVTL